MPEPTPEELEAEPNGPVEEMPAFEVIGTCPSEFRPDPSGHLVPSSAYDTGPCYGFRDKPDRVHTYLEYLDPFRRHPSGTQIQGILQFFYLLDHELDTRRKHSCFVMKWDPRGRLVLCQIDNYKQDIVPAVLWERNDDSPQRPSSALEPSGCPILPPASSPPDTYEETAGAIIRWYAVRGTYGHDSSAVISSFPDSSLCNGDSVPVYYKARNMCEELRIEDADKTLEGRCSEVACRFDSAGCLKKVYFGGIAACDRNPCVWDRDNSPPGTVGILVPFIQFVDDNEKNFRLMFMRYDCMGQLMWVCHYATFCQCIVGGESSSEPMAGCPCETVACVHLNVDCVINIHNNPPASVVLPCKKAMQQPRDPNCQEAMDTGDIDPWTLCVYTFAGSGGADCADTHLHTSCVGEGDESAVPGTCGYLTLDICGHVTP